MIELKQIKTLMMLEKYLDGYTYNGIEKEVLEGEDIKVMLETYARVGEIWGARKDGNTVAFAGIHPVWQGVGQVWLLFNKEAEALGKSVIKETKRVLQLYFDNGCRRLQTYVLADKEVAVRFIEFLGFKQEGLMKNFYKDKSDVYIYARLKGE